MQVRQPFIGTIGQSASLIGLALALAWLAQASEATFTFTLTDSGSGTFSYGALQATDHGDRTCTATSGYPIVMSDPGPSASLARRFRAGRRNADHYEGG